MAVNIKISVILNNGYEKNDSGTNRMVYHYGHGINSVFNTMKKYVKNDYKKRYPLSGGVFLLS